MSDTAAEDVLEFYQFETLEQLRVVSDELRVAILTLVAERSMTVTQVAEALGQAPAKVHYHMRELERVGVVRLVATREKGGILEKYYRAVARHFTTGQHLFLQPSAGDEALDLVRDTLRVRVEALVRAMRLTLRPAEHGAPPEQPTPEKTLSAHTAQLWLTPTEMETLLHQMYTLLEPFGTPRGVADERECTFTAFSYETRMGQPPAPRVSHDDQEDQGTSTLDRAAE